jgi:DNA-binding MarR family transcriptional regulator
MSLAEPQSVDELLNYRLARLLSATSAAGIRLLEGRFGVTRREWGLLGLLAVGGPMSPSALAARAGLDRAKVSLSLNGLAEKGLTRRSSVRGDARRVSVALTEQGRAVYEEAFPPLAAIHKAVLTALTANEIRFLDDVLMRLAESAQRLNASEPVAEKADRRHGGSRARAKRVQANGGCA